MNTYRLLLILFVLLCSARASTAALVMPEEISNTHIGMTAEELKAARPNAKFTSSKVPVDPEKMKAGSFALLERLEGGGPFHTATYWLKDGKVITIGLLGSPSRGQERASRQKVVRDAVQRWGKAHSKHTREDGARPGKAQAKLTWEIDDIQIDLELPRNRAKEDRGANNFGLSFRPAPAAKKHPWKELKMSEAERKALFKEHDADE